MTSIAIGIGIFLLAWFLLGPLFTGNPGGVAFAKDDPAWVEAKAQARATLPEFFARFRSPRPGDEDFIVKFNLTPDLPDGEHIWAENLDEQHGRLFGDLANDPLDGRFREGQRVAIDPALICDWGFWENRVAQGHYMTRVMIEQTGGRVARREKKALGWE